MSAHEVSLSAVLGARVPEIEGRVDLHLADGTLTAVLPAGVRPPAPGPVLEADGRVVLPGLVDAHLHLDKACLHDRVSLAGGGLPAAIAATAAVKPGFTVDDIRSRGQRVLERLVARGVSAARVHVEVDPILGLTSVEAHLALREEWADRITLQLVAFPQEGSLRDPATGGLLDEAMRAGCDVVGACPYADADQHAAIVDGFARAERFGVPLDFHIDFTDDPGVHLVDDVCALTSRYGMAGRVAVGHVTSLAAMPPGAAAQRVERIADAGVAVIALPTTDLYLSGRDAEAAATRGLTRVLALLDASVPVSLATNNHANAFTPVTSDPLQLTWLTMLLSHAAHARWPDLLRCVTAHPARTLGLDGGVLAAGAPADVIVADCREPSEAVTAGPSVVAVIRRGRLQQLRLPVPLGPRSLGELHDDAVGALDVDVPPA